MAGAASPPPWNLPLHCLAAAVIPLGRSTFTSGCRSRPGVFAGHILLRPRHLARWILRTTLVHPILRRTVLSRSILVHPVVRRPILHRPIVHSVRRRAVVAWPVDVIAIFIAPVLRRTIVHPVLSRPVVEMTVVAAPIIDGSSASGWRRKRTIFLPPTIPCIVGVRTIRKARVHPCFTG